MKFYLFLIAYLFIASTPEHARTQTLSATTPLHQLSSTSTELSVSTSALNFDTSLTSHKDSLSLWIRNRSTDTISITDISTFDSVFSVRDTQFTIPPSDSVRAWVYFSSVHNLTYSDVGVIENTSKSGAVAFTIRGVKKYPDTYYNSTQGLSGEALKTAIHDLTINQTNRHYDGIRDLMFLSVDTVAGQLECVYTGRKIAVTTRSDMQTNGNFNTEHTWPQSKFNEQEPEKADINHLFPTDETANGRRSSYPFDVVVSTPTWEVGGSKLGKNSNNATVFEPRDVHKGDLSRAMFYFILRYQNWETFWTDAGVNQEAAFRKWNKQDPVSSKEITRNNRVAQASVQGKRNPFIDHPEFVDRISKFDGTAVISTTPKIVVRPLRSDSLITEAGDTARYQMVIVNAGSATLTLSSITSSSSVFTLTAQSMSIAAHSYSYAELRFIPVANDSVYSGTITINSNDGTTGAIHINVTGNSGNVTAVVEEPSLTPRQFTLEQNFPNPFNPGTMFRYSLPTQEHVTFTIFNVLGQTVETVVDEVQQAGVKSVQWNASSLPGGIYFYRLSAGTYSETKKLLLIK